MVDATVRIIPQKVSNWTILSHRMQQLKAHIWHLNEDHMCVLERRMILHIQHQQYYSLRNQFQALKSASSSICYMSNYSFEMHQMRSAYEFRDTYHRVTDLAAEHAAEMLGSG